MGMKLAATALHDRPWFMFILTAWLLFDRPPI